MSAGPERRADGSLTSPTNGSQKTPSIKRKIQWRNAIAKDFGIFSAIFGRILGRCGRAVVEVKEEDFFKCSWMCGGRLHGT